VDAAGDVVVTVPVTNTGAVVGREVVQVYTSLAGSAVARPPRELKAFASVELRPGQTRAVELTVRRKDLAYWDVRVDRWVVEGGDYTIAVGASSRDLRSTATVAVGGDTVGLPLTMESSIGDLMSDPVSGPVVGQAIAGLLGGLGADAAGASMMADPEGMQKMLASFPVGRLAGFPGIPVTPEQIQGLIAMANARR
jgi:beta-glucosidase